MQLLDHLLSVLSNYNTGSLNLHQALMYCLQSIPTINTQQTTLFYNSRSLMIRFYTIKPTYNDLYFNLKICNFLIICSQVKEGNISFKWSTYLTNRTYDHIGFSIHINSSKINFLFFIV